MRLFTKLKIPKGIDISYQDSTVSLGSCFADNMGNKLKEGKFNVCANPFGIIYNPTSIVQALNSIIDNRLFNEADLFYHNGLWHSWMHHGSYSHHEKTRCLDLINSSLQEAHLVLKKSKVLILTLGSAYVYKYHKGGNTVANCHKVPNGEFEKSRLSLETISNGLENVFTKLKAFNPDIEIIITVSPIRHIRDGIIENQRSKSILLLASEVLCQSSFVSYFPSYELIMDELRDYRFYEEDMIHPNKVAVNYIWERFMETYFSDNTADFYTRILKLVRGYQHKVLHSGTKEHQLFVQQQIEKSKEIMKELPVDFHQEIKLIQGQL